MNLSLFDLHCDTAYEMYRQKQSLFHNSLAVSLEKAKGFQRYIQIMALWTDHRLSDEAGWNAFHKTVDYLRSDEAIRNKNASVLTTCPEEFDGGSSLFLSVEDARILCKDDDRIDHLWDVGVRFLTPLWKGETCIGGSHDTSVGLTDFGKHTIEKAIRLGMIADISHASERSAYEMFEIASNFNRPIIASHSNAYDICPVSRNLHKWQAEAILNCVGVVGINLYPLFLHKERTATLQDILSHIEYFAELGLEAHLCLGCDMDGASLPQEIQDISELPKLADLLLQKNYTESFVQNLFFDNAYRFARKSLKP